MSQKDTQKAFQSEKLQKAFNKLESKAELINQNLDAISGDIKSLEERLQNLHLPLNAQVKVAANSKLTKEEEDQTKIYSDCSFRALEYLKWEKDEHSGRFRVIYQRLVESDDIPGLSIESILRPLIECPAGVRLRMHAYLDKLIESLTEQIEM